MAISLLTVPVFGLSTESQESEIARLKTEIEQSEKMISRARKTINRLKKQLAEQKKRNKRLLVLCRKNKIEVDDKNLILVSDNFESAGSGTIAYLDTKNQRHNYESWSYPNAANLTSYQKFGYENTWGRDYIKLIQIIDKNNAAIDLIYRKEQFKREPIKIYSKRLWLTGIDTTSYSDGDYMEYDMPLIIQGKKTYETVLGNSATIPIISPLNLSQYQIIAVEKQLTKQNRGK